jgi:hypothetical protein
MRAIALAVGFALMAAGADVPRPATDIGITLPDGKALNLADYRGKVVCLTFILTT